MAKKLRAYLVDLLKVTVKHCNGESKISENQVSHQQPCCLYIGGYSGNGVRGEQQLQIREYNEKIINNHHRSRSAPLGNHELFHHRIHPDHPCDSLPDESFMSPVNRYQTTDFLLPKLAKNMIPTSPGAPQPPKVAFVDTTTGMNSEENNATPTCLNLFSFCHYCGRSSGIRLAWCLNCQNTVYCSQSCRQSHWDEGHKTECTDLNSFKTHRKCEYIDKHAI